MKDSQKYCLVAFVEPRAVGVEFDMTEWPLHLTLADVFAVERETADIDQKLASLLSESSALEVVATKQSVLGETPVMLVKKTDELERLHNEIIDLLEQSDAVFNTPAYTRIGFIPHCTIQSAGRLCRGDTVKISEIALVDMFPDGDWKRRKTLKVFKLKG